MELQSVRITNFLSVDHAVVDFSGSGVTLVVGPTGSGKSALLVEPLLWLFYDTLNRPVERSQMRGVQRRYRRDVVGGDTSVEAWFSNAGHSYYVKRSLKSGWELSCDGAAVTPYLRKEDGVAAMRSVIGLPLRLFCAIAVMGQGFTERFSGFGDSERTSIIEDFLGAADYERAHELSKHQLAALEVTLSGLCSRKATLDRAIETTRRQLLEAQDTAAKWSELAAAERKRVESECEAIGLQLGSGKELLGKCVASQEECGVLLNQWLSHESETQSKVESLVQLESQLVGRQTELSRRVSNFSSLKDSCPTCGQAVSNESVRHEVDSGNSNLAALSGELQRVSASLSQARLEYQSVRGSTEAVRRRGAALVNQSVAINTELSRLESRYQALQSELSRVDDAGASMHQSIQSLANRLASEEAQRDEVWSAVLEYQQIKSRLSWWIEGFSIRGIRSKRLGDVLESMNANLKLYCEQLFDGDIEVRLLPEKQQKTASAKSVVTISVDSSAGSYGFSSGGQGRCIDLALHFALRRFAMQAVHGWGSNFLVGDEVFDHLDRDLSVRALEIIKGEAKRVFLVTHSLDLQSLCDSVWRVKCEDQKTTLN